MTGSSSAGSAGNGAPTRRYLINASCSPLDHEQRAFRNSPKIHETRPEEIVEDLTAALAEFEAVAAALESANDD